MSVGVSNTTVINPEPVVSTEPLPEKHEDAATYHIGSDRYPYSIVSRSANGKTVVVQGDDARLTNKDGIYGQQQAVYTRNPDRSTKVFTLRKNGRWYLKGYAMGEGGQLTIGARNFYNDPSF